MTATAENGSAPLLTAIVVFSMVVMQMPFVGVAVAANPADNVSQSTNSTGNRTTMTVDDGRDDDGSGMSQSTVTTGTQLTADGATEHGATVTIDSVKANEPISVSLDTVRSGEVAIGTVTLEFGKTTYMNNELRITVADSAPSGVPAAKRGDVKGYLTVKIDGNLAESVTSGSFTFTLDADSIPNDPSTVNVTRYQDGEWRPVETAHLGDQQFKVVTSGYSTFVITIPADQRETATPTAEPTATEVQPASPTPQVTKANTERQPPVTTTDAEGSGFGVPSASAALIGALLLVRRRAN